MRSSSVQSEGRLMIWMSRRFSGLAEGEAATGTYADGLFPLLAAQELANRGERTFRDSYARDYSLARKLEAAPQPLTY